MFGILFRDFLSVFFIGVIIKLLDDMIDAETDKILDKSNWWNAFGMSIIPYTFILFSLAVMLNKDLTVPLFLSAYVVGMGKEFNQKYLLGLPGWVESLLVITTALFIFNWLNIFTSLAVLIAVQFIDDLLDYSQDRKTGEKNFAALLGFGEAFICLVILLTALLFYSPYKLFLVMSAYLVINLIIEKNYGKRLFRCS